MTTSKPVLSRYKTRWRFLSIALVFAVGTAAVAFWSWSSRDMAPAETPPAKQQVGAAHDTEQQPASALPGPVQVVGSAAQEAEPATAKSSVDEESAEFSQDEAAGMWEPALPERVAERPLGREATPEEVRETRVKALALVERSMERLERERRAAESAGNLEAMRRHAIRMERLHDRREELRRQIAEGDTKQSEREDVP